MPDVSSKLLAAAAAALLAVSLDPDCEANSGADSTRIFPSEEATANAQAVGAELSS